MSKLLEPRGSGGEEGLKMGDIFQLGSPVFICVVHGEVKQYITSKMADKPEYICQQCWWDFLKNELGTMQIVSPIKGTNDELPT